MVSTGPQDQAQEIFLLLNVLPFLFLGLRLQMAAPDFEVELSPWPLVSKRPSSLVLVQASSITRS